jgi:hypothetical protein
MTGNFRGFIILLAKVNCFSVAVLLIALDLAFYARKRSPLQLLDVDRAYL